MIDTAIRGNLRKKYSLYAEKLYRDLIIENIVCQEQDDNGYYMDYETYISAMIEIALYMKKSGKGFFDLKVDEISDVLTPRMGRHLGIYDIVFDFPHSELLIDYFYKRIGDE